MILPEKAGEAYLQVLKTIEVPSETKFFQENEQWGYLEDGANAVVDFVIKRPALLILDSMSVECVVNFADKEWYEAEVENNFPENDLPKKNKLEDELGDLGFFALLAGMLFWEEMKDEQKDFVVRALEWAEETAQVNGIELARVIERVATLKDPANYREEIYQIDSEENIRDIPERVENVRRIGRSIRNDLNGKWKVGQLIEVLNRAYIGEAKDSELAIKIEALAYYSGIELGINC
jgi:hypothetical protein